MTTYCARITSPLCYRTDAGFERSIPVGPCLVQTSGGPSMDIVWGTRGQSSIALTIEAIQIAEDQGYLVLLD